MSEKCQYGITTVTNTTGKLLAVALPMILLRWHWRAHHRAQQNIDYDGFNSISSAQPIHPVALGGGGPKLWRPGDASCLISYEKAMRDEPTPENTITRIIQSGAVDRYQNLHFTLEFADGHRQTFYFPVGELPAMVALFASYGPFLATPMAQAALRAASAAMPKPTLN